MTVMEADESDEYLKIVCAPQLLKFFTISDQIHSMYQLMQLQYSSYLTWNIRKKMAALTAKLHLVRVTPKIFGVGFEIFRRTGVRSTRCRRTEVATFGVTNWRTLTNLLDMWRLLRVNKNKFTILFECLYLCRTPLTVQYLYPACTGKQPLT